jgi:hypothetical protein
MEEHGHWDDSTQRFVHHVMSIEFEDELTHQRALAVYHDAKQRLAQRGFVHAFVMDYRSKSPHSDQLAVAERVTA